MHQGWATTQASQTGGCTSVECHMVGAQAVNAIMECNGGAEAKQSLTDRCHQDKVLADTMSTPVLCLGFFILRRVNDAAAHKSLSI